MDLPIRERGLNPSPALEDENGRGLGRRAGVIQDERRQSGGLSDEPEPLVERAPFRQTGG